MLFPTGRGAPNGNPLMPAIKVCGNEKSNKNLGIHLDVDVSSIINGSETLEEAGARLLQVVVEVASGRLTQAEIVNFDGSMEILINGPVM